MYSFRPGIPDSQFSHQLLKPWRKPNLSIGKSARFTFSIAFSRETLSIQVEFCSISMNALRIFVIISTDYCKRWQWMQKKTFILLQLEHSHRNTAVDILSTRQNPCWHWPYSHRSSFVNVQREFLERLDRRFLVVIDIFSADFPRDPIRISRRNNSVLLSSTFHWEYSKHYVGMTVHWSKSNRCQREWHSLANKSFEDNRARRNFENKDWKPSEDDRSSCEWFHSLEHVDPQVSNETWKYVSRIDRSLRHRHQSYSYHWSTMPLNRREIFDKPLLISLNHCNSFVVLILNHFVISVNKRKVSLSIDRNSAHSNEIIRWILIVNRCRKIHDDVMIILS